MIKPRNHVALAMRSRSGGAHGKSRKAERRKMKMATRKEVSHV
jgi:hypothetical protein